MQYDKPTTVSYSLSCKYSKLLEELDSVIVNEGGSCARKLGGDVVVLNLDKVAIAQKMASIPSTMDITFGITDDNGRNSKMVLVDFKFRQEKVGNIGKADLEGKVGGSKMLMVGTPPVFQEYYFVFPPNKKKEATSHFARRLFNNKTKIPFKSVDINDLLTIFFQ